MVAGPPGDTIGAGAGRADAGARALPAGRLMFRFGVGLARLSGGGLTAALRALDASPIAAGGTAPPAGVADRPTPFHAFVGALVSAPAAFAALRARVAGRLSRARRLARRGGRLLAAAPGTRRLLVRAEAWRARTALRLAALSVVGAREEAEGLALARAAVQGLFEVGLAEVAASPEIERVIREQSQGLAVSALATLRDRSARADGLVEGAAGRFFGRRSRRRDSPR